MLRSARELVVERGVEATTVTAIAARSGVSRATIYSRWPIRRVLIAAAARDLMGEPMQWTDDMAVDVARATAYTHDMLSRLATAGVLAPMIAGFIARRVEDRLTYRSMAPGRQFLVDEYGKLAPGAGLRQDVGGDVVFDLIVAVCSTPFWQRARRRGLSTSGS